MSQAFRILSPSYGARRLIANITLLFALSAATAIAEPITIAALGDSLTAGYGLPAEQGLVPQLQAYLTDQGADAVMINAGVSGDTTAGGLSRMDWTLTPEVDALIVTLGGNDMLRGIDPAVTRANLEAIILKAKAAGLPVLLVGLTATNNFGPDFKTQFDTIFTDLAAKHDTLLLQSFFRPLLIDPKGMAAFMQPDGIHPDAVGVQMIVGQLGPVVKDLIAVAQTQ